MEAVMNKPSALQYAPDELKAAREFMLQAVMHNSSALKAYENAIGAQPPVGFWEPLDLYIMDELEPV
eukprot:691657-Heterocapsa_arctica.AAC.1